MNDRVVVIGLSLGGLKVLKEMLPALPADFPLPIIIIQHLDESSSNVWIELLDNICKLQVVEAEEKEKIRRGVVYIAPANYHLLIERDETFSLAVTEKVNFARPSIDVTFECAAETYRKRLIGVILTGLNMDGAQGLKRINDLGGITIVQDPADAEAPEMPKNALKKTKPDYVVPGRDIVPLLIKLSKTTSSSS
jgi:two-component system chemotaxis response regulator CheB